MEPERSAIPIGASDHATGSPDATVTLLEYGDYESFYRGAAENILRVVQECLASPIRIVFRHFPLANIQEHAERAALAAEAAAAQGKILEAALPDCRSRSDEIYQRVVPLFPATQHVVGGQK